MGPVSGKITTTWRSRPRLRAYFRVAAIADPEVVGLRVLGIVVLVGQDGVGGFLDNAFGYVVIGAGVLGWNGGRGNDHLARVMMLGQVL